MKFISYITDRLKEGSSWAAILAFVAAQFNLQLSDDVSHWFVQLGVCLAAGVAILLKDRGVDG